MSKDKNAKRIQRENPSLKYGQALRVARGQSTLQEMLAKAGSIDAPIGENRTIDDSDVLVVITDTPCPVCSTNEVRPVGPYRVECLTCGNVLKNAEVSLEDRT